MTEIREAGERPGVPELGRLRGDAPETSIGGGGSGSVFPTFPEAVVLVVLVLALQSGIVVAALLLDPTSGTYGQHPLALGVANLLAFGIVILAAARRRGVEARAVCPLAPVSAGILFPIAALLLGTIVLLSDVDNLTRSVFPPPEALTEALANVLDTGKHPLGSFFLLVAVAPATEETLFRGLILRGFLANYSKRRAILFSALLFAAMHVNPWQFVSAFVAGVLLAWLLIETGSLVPCLFAHALANGTAYLAGLLPVEVPGFTGEAGGSVEFQPFWLNAAGAALAVGGYLLLRRAFRKSSRPPETFRRRPDPAS